MARYVPTEVPYTDDIAQLQRWLREEFNRVRGSTDDVYALANFTVANMVAAAYGGIGQDAVSNLLPDIGSQQWIDFTGFDVPLVVPKAVSYDFGNDAMIMDSVGIFYVSIKLTLKHNESQAGREIALRFDNKNTPTINPVEFRYGVGRNTGVTNLTLGAFFEAQEDTVGDPIGLEIGGGDAFTNVDSIGAIYQLHSVSQYQGDAFEAQAKQIRSQ